MWWLAGVAVVAGSGWWAWRWQAAHLDPDAPGVGRLAWSAMVGTLAVTAASVVAALAQLAG